MTVLLGLANRACFHALFLVVLCVYTTVQITEEKLRAMRSGCTIDGVRYKGMFVRVEGGGGKGREGRNAWLTIECTEGKVCVLIHTRPCISTLVALRLKTKNIRITTVYISLLEGLAEPVVSPPTPTPPLLVRCFSLTLASTHPPFVEPPNPQDLQVPVPDRKPAGQDPPWPFHPRQGQGRRRHPRGNPEGVSAAPGGGHRRRVSGCRRRRRWRQEKNRGPGAWDGEAQGGGGWWDVITAPGGFIVERGRDGQKERWQWSSFWKQRGEWFEGCWRYVGRGEGEGGPNTEGSGGSHV